MNSRGHWATGLLSALGLLAMSRLASASPADTFGIGSRSVAMGGAVGGRVTDFSANYYNPSSLALADSTQLTLGYVHVDPTLELDERAEDLPSLDSWQLGLVIPGTVLDVPVAFGLAAHVTGDRLARIHTFTESEQRWFLYDARPQQLYLSTNLAARLTPWLAVGAGISFVSSTTGTLHVTGTSVATNVYDSRLEHEVEADLVSVRQLLLSTTLSPTETLDVGLVYRGQGAVNLDIDSNIAGAVDWATILIPIEYVLASQTVASFLPRQVTLGGRYGVLRDLDAHLDLTWVQWSQAPSPVSAIEGTLDVDEPPGLILDLAEPPSRAQQTGGLRDRIVPRLGLEWRSNDDQAVTWALRTGYSYEPSPVVGGSAANLVDSDRHIVSFGTGLGFFRFGPSERGSLRWDSHLQVGLLSDRQLPAPVDPPLSVGGHFIAVGTNVSLHL